MTYKEAIKAVKHLKAIGETSIWLRDDSEKPWQHVTKVEGGGSHRLDMNTSVWFEAVDPKTRLNFRWNFDIEPMEANGKGHYEIDAIACRNVMTKLEGKARRMFSDYLAACAAKVRSKGEEWKRITDRQFSDAETLEQLAAAGAAVSAKKVNNEKKNFDRDVRGGCRLQRMVGLRRQPKTKNLV